MSGKKPRPKAIPSRNTAAAMRRERQEAANPYHITNRFTEKAKTPFYGCAFNQFVKYPRPQILAAVTENFLHLYELPTKKKIIKKRASAEVLLGEKDDFYTVAWCQQPSDIPGVPSTKLVVGGLTGRMYVVDHKTMVVERQLTGLRGMCNEIRTNPQMPTIIAAVCNDWAVRLFDIRCDAPLVICGGRWIHCDKVMSMDWSPDGTYLVSSGYDHKVFLWNFSEPRISEHLKNAIEALDRGEEAPTVEYTSIVHEMVEKIWSPKKKALFMNNPETFTNSIHFDSVDCIRMRILKGQMYFVSRNCGNIPILSFWRFGSWNKSKVMPEDGAPDDSVMQLSRKAIHGEPVPYFMKFDLDADFRWCVVPGSKGDVQFFELQDRKAHGPAFTTIVHAEQWIVRQVAFSDRSEFFVTVSDSGTISRFDKNLDPKPPVEEKLKVKRKKEVSVPAPVIEEENRVAVEEGIQGGASPGPADFDDYEMEDIENTDPLLQVPFDGIEEEDDDDIEVVWEGKKGECPGGPEYQDEAPGSPESQDENPGSPEYQDEDPGSPESQDEAPGSSEYPDEASGSPESQDEASQSPEAAALNNQVEAMEIEDADFQAEHLPDDENIAEAAQNGSELQNQEKNAVPEAEAPGAENQQEARPPLWINGPEAQGALEEYWRAVERDRANGAPGDLQAYRDAGDGYQVAYDDPTRYFHLRAYGFVKNTYEGPPVPESAPYRPEDYEKRELRDDISYVRIEEINEDKKEEAENQDDVVQELPADHAQIIAPHEIPVAGEEIVGQEEYQEEPDRQEDDEEDEILNLTL